MLRITELRLPLDHAEGALRAAVLARLGLADEQLRELTVFRRAWDARKKSAVVLSYTVDCRLADGVDEAAVLARLAGDRQVRIAPDTTLPLRRPRAGRLCGVRTGRGRWSSASAPAASSRR